MTNGHLRWAVEHSTPTSGFICFIVVVCCSWCCWLAAFVVVWDVSASAGVGPEPFPDIQHSALIVENIQSIFMLDLDGGNNGLSFNGIHSQLSLLVCLALARDPQFVFLRFYEQYVILAGLSGISPRTSLWLRSWVFLILIGCYGITT